MKYSSQTESITIQNVTDSSVSLAKEETKPPAETQKIEDLIQNHKEKIEKVNSNVINKTSILKQEPFDVSNLKNFGSTCIIGEDFYIVKSQNRSHLSSEEEKQMSESLIQTYKKFLLQSEKFPNQLSTKKNKIIKMIYKFPNFLSKKIKLYQELIRKSLTDSSKKEYEDKLARCEMYKILVEESIANEKHILFINHRNCLKINWFGDFNTHFVFVSEFIENKDLLSWTRSFYNKEFIKFNISLADLPWLSYMSETLIKYFMHQMVLVLECFKAVKIIHGNLTLSNILLTKDMQLKVTDFACSRFLIGNEMFKIRKYENEVDSAYQPPEYFRDLNFVEAKDANKIDIFTIACCLIMMATGESLCKDIEKCSSDRERIAMIVKNVGHIYISEFVNRNIKRTPQFILCLQKMLEAFEKGRINLDELKETAWVKSDKLLMKNEPKKFVTELMKADYVPYRNMLQENYLEKEINEPRDNVKYTHVKFEDGYIPKAKKNKFKILKKAKHVWLRNNPSLNKKYKLEI